MRICSSSQVLVDRRYGERRSTEHPRRGGGLLHDSEPILGSSDELDPDIATEINQYPSIHVRTTKPTEEEATAASRSMPESKAVGLDELPEEMLKQGFDHDPKVLGSSTRSSRGFGEIE